MSSPIYVSNDSAEALVAALNQALAVVVTQDNIKRILTDPYDTYMYEHLHPMKGSAIGSVRMLTVDRQSFSISVSIGVSLGGPNQPAFVRVLAERGCLRYKVANSLTRVDFSYDGGSGQYEARTEIPSKLRQVVSDLAIEFR